MFNQKEYTKNWRRENQKYIKEYAKIYYQKNKERMNKRSKDYMNIHKERIKMQHKEYLKKLGADNRILVLSHYSNGIMKCACCKEDTFEFLTIDHINNNGNIERKRINKKGFSFYCWLIKNGFPKGYQVLCMNCNWAKRVNGICPHKVNKAIQPIIIKVVN